jgi:hypothetical protein
MNYDLASVKPPGEAVGIGTTAQTTPPSKGSLFIDFFRIIVHSSRIHHGFIATCSNF